jgi:hypothetical protein
MGGPLQAAWQFAVMRGRVPGMHAVRRNGRYRAFYAPRGGSTFCGRLTDRLGAAGAGAAAGGSGAGGAAVARGAGAAGRRGLDGRHGRSLEVRQPWCRLLMDERAAMGSRGGQALQACWLPDWGGACAAVLRALGRLDSEM